jgi:dUTP pyrophosphatase
MSEKPPVPFKKLVPHAVLPQYAHEGDAGMDLFASEETEVKTGEITMVKTGLACELPYGSEFQVRPKSGLAAKHGITVVNTPGTIDCSYRGEIGVVLTTLKADTVVKITRGMKVAQLVYSPVKYCQPVEVSELSDSERGSGGFGSTGK